MAEFDRPLILNAVAYARYALEINGMPGYGHTTEVADLARGLVTMATQSNIPQDEALRFRAVVATDEATEHYRQEIERDARTLANGGRLTRGEIGGGRRSTFASVYGRWLYSAAVL